MDQLYLGHSGWEYLFMITWLVLCVTLVYSIVRIQTLKDELEYRRYLANLMTGKR